MSSSRATNVVSRQKAWTSMPAKCRAGIPVAGVAAGICRFGTPTFIRRTPNLSTPLSLHPSRLCTLAGQGHQTGRSRLCLLIGFSMYLWASGGAASHWASLASGVMVMFSGSFTCIYMRDIWGICLPWRWVPLLFLIGTGSWMPHSGSGGRRRLGYGPADP